MPKKKIEETCENADKNPTCPYIVQINAQSASITAAATAATHTITMLDQVLTDVGLIKKALRGDDMQGGIVKKIADLEASIKTAASWANFGKPIILGVIMAVIAGLISRFI